MSAKGKEVVKLRAPSGHEFTIIGLRKALRMTNMVYGKLAGKRTEIISVDGVAVAPYNGTPSPQAQPVAANVNYAINNWSK